MPKKRPTLSNRILIFFYPIPVVVLFTFLILSYTQSKELIVQAEKDKLLAIGRTLITQISAEEHQTVEVTYTEKDFVKTPEEYLQATQALLRAKKQNQLNTDIYTLIISPKLREKIKANPDEFHKNATEFLYVSSEEPYYRHQYDYKPEMKAAFFEGKEVFVPDYESDNGSWISVYFPIINQQGQTVAILELDKKLNELYSAQFALFRNKLIWVSIILLLTFFISKKISQGVIAPIEDLKQATEAMSHGNYSESINVQFCSHELSTLTETIEDMRQKTLDSFYRVKQLDKMKYDCLGLLNHELRTPLNFIASGVELLKMEESYSKNQETIDIIENGITKLNQLSQQISTTSSLNFSTDNIRKGTHTLQSLCNTVEGFIGDDLDEAELTVHHNFEETDSLFCDEILFRELLNKIYKNWIKFAPKSEVFIDFNETVAETTISFTDRGVGIPEDKLTDIFSPFVIGGNILNHSDGNGLGLAIAESICQAHQGTIRAENNTPEAGCTFIVCIPKKIQLKRPDGTHH